MKPREIESAKRIPQSKARQRVLEKGMDAVAIILLQMLGHKFEVEESKTELIDAIVLMAEVLNDGS